MRRISAKKAGTRRCWKDTTRAFSAIQTAQPQIQQREASTITLRLKNQNQNQPLLNNQRSRYFHASSIPTTFPTFWTTRSSPTACATLWKQPSRRMARRNGRNTGCNNKRSTRNSITARDGPGEIPGRLASNNGCPPTLPRRVCPIGRPPLSPGSVWNDCRYWRLTKVCCDAYSDDCACVHLSRKHVVEQLLLTADTAFGFRALPIVLCVLYYSNSSCGLFWHNLFFFLSLAPYRIEWNGLKSNRIESNRLHHASDKLYNNRI